MSKYVCEDCKDTHLMPLEGGYVPCTKCRTPCPKCRKGGRGAFCEQTPCDCDCHREPQPSRVEVANEKGDKVTVHLYPKKGARRKDTDHGPERPRVDWTNSQIVAEDHLLVYGETAQQVREKARDKLLIVLARAVPVTSDLLRDELLRAARELEELL